MDKIKELADRLFGNQTDSSVRIKILLITGIIAMLIIALPDMCSNCSGTDESIKTVEMDTDEYALQLEKRLEQMISVIEGAGETHVMVTLQNGVEYIYASEDKVSVNTSESSGNNGSQSSEARENSENSYIIIKDDNGERALIRTQLMPAVNGVVVVCQGAGDPEVAERIRLVVTTALNISSKRVCITQLSTD